ncbi:GPP34 family phosphoprotein [Streptomyces sp. NPDC006527]|uniref:GOLPH3/VPS74 family protein n=1 Tax=Streptomyces sp. NPDC006527 TaxID=3364749 RepID=UPI0036A923C9
MTTPRDLLIVALAEERGRPVEAGDLSLALAGAELIDLLRLPASPAIRLDGGRIVPGHLDAPADRLLAEAAASLVMDDPWEPVGDWLWRRGDSLAATYLAVLEEEGLIVRKGGGRFRSGEPIPADSPSRRRAVERWASGEPVLVALAQSLDVHGELGADPPNIADYAVATVLAAVNDALLELDAERQRRSIEQAAFDNVWRGLD